MKKGKERKYWLDDPRNVDKIFWSLCALCAGLGLADLLYHKHVHFRWESLWDFHGIYGFACSILLVLTAKQLRKVLMRDEDFYDR